MSVFMLKDKFSVVDDQPTASVTLVDFDELTGKKNLSVKGVDLEFLKSCYGDLIDGSLYCVDLKEKKFVFAVDTDKLIKKNKLDFYQPGNKHINFLLGSKLTIPLINEKYFAKDDILGIAFSEELSKKIDLTHEFLTGLRLKSVSNNIDFSAKSDKNQKKRKINVSSIVSVDGVAASDNYMEALLTAKSLVNTPANFLNPDTYEEFSIDKVTELKERGYNVDIEVFDRSKLQHDGAGLILAVGKASQHAPRIIKLSYRPEGASKLIAIIGKGITYDTGGLNLKPGGSMRNMKKDMGGSASVFGTYILSVLSGVKYNMDIYLAVAENSVSSNAARPGDVYVAKNGIAVEIDNTDAEGRLVMADALCYANETDPDYLFDIATLTGAARISLGTQVDVCLTNNENLAELIHKSSIETGDWLWRQPRPATYESSLDSKVANTENTGSRFGGAITAGMFLEKFHTSSNWMHIDTWMWSDKPNMFAKEAGATPKVVCFMAEFLDKLQ